MSNTIRKDRNGKEYKESLKKSGARYKCRCEYCLGKNNTADKIAKKELKNQLKTDEYTIDNNVNYIEDIDDPYFTTCNK